MFTTPFPHGFIARCNDQSHSVGRCGWRSRRRDATHHASFLRQVAFSNASARRFRISKLGAKFASNQSSTFSDKETGLGLFSYARHAACELILALQIDFTRSPTRNNIPGNTRSPGPGQKRGASVMADGSTGSQGEHAVRNVKVKVSGVTGTPTSHQRRSFLRLMQVSRRSNAMNRLL